MAVAILGAIGAAGIDLLGGLIWLALAVGHVLPINDLLAGFGSEAVVLVASLMAVAEGLRRIGWTSELGAWLADHAGPREGRTLPLVAAVAACIAAVMESTAAVVTLVPVMARIGSRSQLRPRRLYMVVALGTMAGGLLTLIGTSANLVANGVLTRLGLQPFHFLELMPIGLALVAVATLYVATVGRMLLPRPTGVMLDQAVEALRAYAAEVRVESSFPWAGARLDEAHGLRSAGVDVLAITRGGQRIEDPPPQERLQAGDLLTVTGGATELAGLTPLGDGEVSAALAEGLLPPGSLWSGRTLADLGARGSGLRVLGIWRHGQTLAGSLARIRLQAGDVLLARARRPVLARLQSAGYVAWLQEVQTVGDRSAPWRRWTALAILAGFFAIGVSGSLDLAAAAFATAVALAICGSLPGHAIYDAIEWKVVLLLAGVIPLGEAVSASGLADRMAGWLTAAVQPLGPWAAVPVLFLATGLLTQALSNVATAAVMTPVAVRLATVGRLEPKAAVAVVLIAVMCTPLTHLANKPTLLVQEPGGYRMRSYLRIGLPFAVLALAVAILVPPHLWPYP